MALSVTFMKAILAMDSYNRGYNPGIDFNTYDALGIVTKASDELNTTHIGLATVVKSSAVFGAGVDSAIGFYAIAYSYGGGKVVSYRGTDGILLDSVFGFPIGGGLPCVAQAYMAFQF